MSRKIRSTCQGTQQFRENTSGEGLNRGNRRANNILAMPPQCATYVVLSASGLSTFTTIILMLLEGNC